MPRNHQPRVGAGSRSSTRSQTPHVRTRSPRNRLLSIPIQSSLAPGSPISRSGVATAAAVEIRERRILQRRTAVTASRADCIRIR